MTNYYKQKQRTMYRVNIALTHFEQVFVAKQNVPLHKLINEIMMDQDCVPSEKVIFEQVERFLQSNSLTDYYLLNKKTRTIEYIEVQKWTLHK